MIIKLTGNVQLTIGSAVIKADEATFTVPDKTDKPVLPTKRAPLVLPLRAIGVPTTPRRIKMRPFRHNKTNKFNPSWYKPKLKLLRQKGEHYDFSTLNLLPAAHDSYQATLAHAARKLLGRNVCRTQKMPGWIRVRRVK